MKSLPATAIEPAPSSNIATAARRFGDDYGPLRGQRWVRLAGATMLLTTAIYVPWMIGSLNRNALWLSLPFLAASALTITTVLLGVLNAWWRKVSPRRPLPHGEEPHVGVIIPCCGESVPMILRTVVSVFEQDWPAEKLTVVVSDDGHDPALRTALRDYPVLYHEPVERWAPGRDGAAKAGNLNDALAFLDARIPYLRFVETRDADDEVGSLGFLRQVIGQLETDANLAYVQTIKESQVSAGDPFNNRESFFYRGQMLGRNAANAVFPCGSGVVWRRAALHDIGEFPTWNLVEDLQSGFEALKRRWHGLYLPIVGAVGQHSPEDIPNVYKQRGTWAIDTVRLLVFNRWKGLRLRQRAQFLELLLFYLNGFTVCVYVPTLICSFLGVVPLESSDLGFVQHLLPLVLATELWLLALNQPFNDRRTRQREPVRELWRVRIIWMGMAPVFMRATITALRGGPNRKPSYKVTRKTDDLRWHWRATMPQTLIVLTVIVVFLYAALNGTFPDPVLLAASVYWGGLNILLLSGFIARGWHGVESFAGRFARPAGGFASISAPEKGGGPT